MAIPLFGATAHGGKILSLDDQSVVADLAALAGTGGTAYSASLVSGTFAGSGWATLRRLVQTVNHDGAATVVVSSWTDGADTGQTISTALVVTSPSTVVAPMLAAGSEFQVSITVSAFDAPVELGSGDLTILDRRSQP